MFSILFIVIVDSWNVNKIWNIKYQIHFKSSDVNICKNPGHAVICERVHGINTEVTKEAFIHVLSTATRRHHCSQQRDVLKVYLSCIFQVTPKGNM